MPTILGAIVIGRIVRAFIATIRLVAGFRVLRTLPWVHIRRLPLQHVWIGLITASLFVTVACTILVLALSSGAAAGIGMIVALAGLATSWMRGLGFVGRGRN
jgi:hypothetical protein